VSYYDTVYVKRTTPVISLSTQDASCAAGGVITVNVAGGTGFQYSLNGAPMQSGNTFSNLASGNYTILVQSGSCAASAQATIALNNTLTVNALPGDTAVCAGGSFSPSMSFSSPNAQFTWTPSQGAGSPLPPGTPVTLNVGNQNTQFIVTATEGQCVAKDTINVTVFTGATANAGSDQTIIAGDQVQLQASGSQGTYLWTPSAGLSATNVLNPMASPQQTTTYTLQVTSVQGCLATDQVTVTVVPYCVKPMEAFTPNGDGINDRWLVTNGGCVREIKAEVFNRYGHRVFQDYAYDNNWDGTYKGKPLPDGTYYFVITYRLINNKLVYQKGNVTILR
jgi:gliding motility-associated-like protein